MRETPSATLSCSPTQRNPHERDPLCHVELLTNAAVWGVCTGVHMGVRIVRLELGTLDILQTKEKENKITQATFGTERN